MEKYKKTLIDILSIVGFKGNKENYANELLFLCLQKSVLVVVNNLTKKQQDQIQSAVMGIRDPVQFGLKVSEYIDKKKYSEALETVYVNSIKSYSSEIMNLLTKQKQEELKNYLLHLPASFGILENKS